MGLLGISNDGFGAPSWPSCSFSLEDSFSSRNDLKGSICSELYARMLGMRDRDFGRSARRRDARQRRHIVLDIMNYSVPSGVRISACKLKILGF